MPAPKTIIDLVTRFESQLASYKSGRYNETELRRDFLDPFIEALGWDIRNVNNATEKYRDVIHESSVEIGGQAKSADYLFQIGGSPIYFVEAKKPSVNIETDPAPAFQLKSYAWSAKLPFSILTDFEQLAFYECLTKPVYNAPPSLGRIELYHFRDYIAKWDEIGALISRSAVTTGAFETYLKGVKGKRGTTDVDDAFLAEMERWREQLAHNIALRNPPISQRELNFAVQTTIDRLIFLRICEDRGIEAEEALRTPPMATRSTATCWSSSTVLTANTIPVCSTLPREGPVRSRRYLHPQPENRRQGLQGYPRQSLSTRKAPTPSTISPPISSARSMSVFSARSFA